MTGDGHVSDGAAHDGETFNMCAHSGKVPEEEGDVCERSSCDDPNCVDRLSEDVSSYY